jgi:tRNA dimethylallyltransferase
MQSIKPGQSSPTGPVPPAATQLPQILVLIGPTAVGKTALSLDLAERLNAEIISADSRLFYRGMDIGTAKPTPQDQARVPHHLIDMIEPDQAWSLADFQKQARQAIAEIHKRGRLPLLVGGTGQYVRAVIEGWQVPRVEADPILRAVLENWATEIGAEGLHARLAVLDPLAAERIDYRNLRRTVRALEVTLATGRPFSAQRRRGPSSYNPLLIGLTRRRPELYARLDERIDAMFQAGLVTEVQGLLERGYAPDLPAFSAIGYREVIAHLRGVISRDEAIALIKRNTRIFVRRQANWFKPADPQIHWYEPGPAALDRIEALVRDWLAEPQQARQR